MWKIQSSLKAACMAAAALAAFGCSQDDLTNQSMLNGNTIITAAFENTGSNTRTSVGDQNKVVWNANDAFNLFYTTNSQKTPTASKFSCPQADGTSTKASFSGALADGATTSYAVYPYQKSMSLSDKTVTMLLPAEFEYSTASNGPMYADATDISKGIEFKHLAGLLKLTVSKGITNEAKKFVITADKNIAGTCTADLSSTDPVLSTPSGDGASKTITVKLNNNANGTIFYIPIPAATYTKLSATLFDGNGNALCNPMEWKNIEVKRGGMRSSSFGFINIDGGTTTSEEMKQAIAEAVEPNTTTEIEISGTIDATSSSSGISSIEIPAKDNSNVNLTLAEVPTTTENAPLELKDNSSSDAPNNAVNTVTFAIPKAETENAPSISITMPQTTVELDASGNDGTTYNKVTALTANNTLVIKKGVTVKNLTVKGGNVRVAGTIETISKNAGTSPIYLIKEVGATLPESTTGFTVVDAATYDLMMAAKNGGTYTLSSDVILSEPLVVTSTMILDLNGHSIKAATKGWEQVLNTKDAVVLVRRGAQLTVNDSSSNKQGSIDTNSNVSILTAVKLTDSNDENGENASQFATLIVNSGTIKGSSYGICGNGTRHNTSITINGGTIEAADATDGTGIYHPQDGTLTVTGGTISGHSSGIEIRAGKLEVKGGTIKHTATEFKKAANGNGTTITGAAVAVSQHTTDKDLNVIISGGELQGGSLYALYEEDLQNENVSNITMKVTGGKFAGQVFSENCKDFIEGGDFNDFSAMTYQADNKDVTVTLDSDVSIINKSVLVPAGKKVTLDLNGHTVTAANKAGDNIVVLGNLTLQDSGNNGKIVASKDYSNEYINALINIEGENASMTMKSGYINAARTTNPANNGQFGVGLFDGADFTMTGGKIEAGWYAVSGNGTYKEQNSIINISAGELISTADYALYLPQAGKTSISGNAIITGACGGIGMRNGSLEISGTPEITSKGTGTTGDWKDGTGNTGNAVISVGCGKPNTYGNCKVSINGGTFTAEGNATVIDKQGTPKHTIAINISGGTFSNTDALDYLTDNANVKVLLNADKSVKGFKTKDGQTVEIDLNNHTLTLADPTVGSTGTETNSCQLLKGSKVTFKNGKVQSNNENIMIQNYCELLLQDVTIEATKAQYVISNNNKSCTINNSTITAGSDKCAFDVFSFGSYTGVTVTVNDGSTINGDVEFGGDNNKKNGKLIINGGTINGNLTVTEAYYNNDDPNIIINGGSFGSYTGWDEYKPAQ